MLRKPNQVIFAFLVFLSSCAVTLPGGSSSGSGNTGSAPIYQGMTVSALSNASNLQSPKNQNDINQENPFDLPNNEKLESKIESDLAEFMMEESLDYYARPSETVRITINIFNPQSYVILSFNLNGRRYQSFEFREGSTSTRLLMDVALQNLPGVQSLTIDEIKYIVDSSGDNQIRDVVMFGDQTVEVGIGYNQLPTVNLVSQTILPTTVTYALDVSDSLNILSTQETAVYFYFFDGETIQKEELVVGNNEVEFNKLTSKTLYQYAVVSALNPLDGEGPVLTYHDVEAFFTSNFIQLLVNTTKESISFEVSVLNGLESGAVNRVDLEKNSEIIATQEISSGSFSELLSNNEYALSVYYDYSHEGESEVLTEVYSLAASTLAKSTPTFSFTDVVAGKEDVTFEYEVTDLDEVGSLSKIELLKSEEVVETLTEFEDTSFTNLLSNNDYQLKATYTYDLNDGVGEQSIFVTNETKTLPKETPEFSFSNLSPTKESITFDYVVTDLDQVGGLIKIELVKGDTIMETFTSFENLSLEGLLSNNQYLLKAYYEVDLNDGIGLQTLVFNQEFTTLAKSTPTFSFTDVVAGKEEVTFEYEVTDLDEVGSLTKIELLKGVEVVETITEFEDTSFSNLLSNNEYTLKATYTYDLNDGVGEQSIVLTNQTKTLPKEVPNIDVLIKDVQSNLIKIELDIQDEDQTIISYTVEFYDKNQILINTFTNESSITLNNLNSYSNYSFDLLYTYSLDETIEYQPLSVTIDREVKTLALPIQVTGVDYITSNTIQTKGEVLVRIYLLNPSNVDLINVITNAGFFEINKALSNSNSVVVKYIDNSIGGRFNILIEGFSYLDNPNEIEINSASETFFEIKVLGTIELLDLMVISDNQYVNVVSAESNSFVKILLINPSEYDIFSIILQQSNIETIYAENFTLSEDKQIITLPWGGDRNIETSQFSFNLNYLVLRGLSYGFDQQSKSDLTFDLNVLPWKVRYIKIVSSLVPLPITNYSELISMNPYGSYYLANDIDISNFNHTTPITFYGFFDGRGQKIKNLNILSISSTVDWREIYVGLFGDLRGYVFNLEIENSSIYLDYKRPIRFGLLTGYLSKGLIQNIKVTGSHNIYVASSQEIEYGNLVGAVGENGSILYSAFNGQLNAQLKAAPLSEGSGPVIGGIVGKTSAAGSIFGNKLFGTLNYEFDITPQSNRYISGYRFGGIAGRENSGYYSFNYVEAAIYLRDKNNVTSQTIYVGYITSTSNTRHTQNVFNGTLSISSSGYLVQSFSHDSGLIIKHVPTFRVYEIIKVIELINTVDNNSSEAYIQSIKDLFNQLEVNEKTLVYNQSEIN